MAGMSLVQQLDQFESYLKEKNLAPNTIRAYLYALRQFLTLYPEADHDYLIDRDYLMLYRNYLIERYKPQTVNLRIRAINCYLESRSRVHERIRMVHLRRDTSHDHVISRADYEYFKSCLLRDKKYPYYFAVWLMAATGLKVSELVEVQVSDIRRGCIEFCSKRKHIRRVRIPEQLQSSCLKWLRHIGRDSGYVFLNRFGKRITASGIRDRLKQLGTGFGLEPSVLHPHSFRHLFAENFLEQCGDITMLSNILGHESIEATRIYLR